MPTLRRHLTNVAVVIAAVAAALAVSIVISPTGGRTIVAAGDGPHRAGGEFHELKPVRIHNTRSAPDVSPAGAKPTGPSAKVAYELSLFGGASPLKFTDVDNDRLDDNVLAVVANVTVVRPTRAGHLTIFPKGSTPGKSSVANFDRGQVVANSVILRPGEDGKVKLFLNTPSGSGSAHVVIDISGWFSTSAPGIARGARVVPVEPTRIFDSKNSGRTLKGVQKIPLQIRGSDWIEPGHDDAKVVGAIVNLTGVNAFSGSDHTHMSIVPGDFRIDSEKAWPKTSNLNLAPGQVRANLAIVPVGADGKIRLFNLQGEVRMVVDVTGYLIDGQPEETHAGRVIPLEAPFRAFDTRRAEFYSQPLGPGRAEDFSFEAFSRDVKVGGEWVGPQSALFGNLTVARLKRQYDWAEVSSHMTAYPTPVGGSVTPPNISNLNFGEGESVPNLALLPYGGGEQPNRIRFFNFAGYVDYLLDVYAVVLDD